ncbi:MAG TPA: [FeFe] hydrogenase, group A [Spirochaetales bacterium]|nr:[FeFe] hydrogenase, group A [Spirochaetales bacterium]HRY53675.1 [FeFe] hydrogenase, group A [Spirochaetia bacterium]HRZ64267.1 [FeFe] hydrogenase, group A [Spirochaetia bacterium]
MSGYVTVDGIKVPIEGEKNLLALARKAGIDIPTFCYHSHLSTYGACRLCLVEINGKEIDASCVVPPKDGMSVRTNTARVRSMRRMNLELLLANHKQDCPTCERSASCKLRDLASKMGLRGSRFRRTREERPLDQGSPCLARDPNKCILCGDCVRYCAEIQGIGAIDFAHRGTGACVTPAFGKSLGEVDCVNCGQCAAICPTAAIVPRTHKDEVWAALDDPEAVVVAQVAPAARIAIGERFGLGSGEAASGRLATALRMLGFGRVYDTAFGADLTVVEEATEFLARAAAAKAGATVGGKLPLFTSCCPAWVKFAEQSFPELLPNLSTCMSPQSMVGSLLKEEAARAGGGEAGKRLVVVSIMPCTAKKYEIARPELSRNGERLVDYVLTTNELASMIQEAGLRFAELGSGPMDLPMGFSSGAGLAFGASGGVSEAVARYVAGGLPAGRPSALELAPLAGFESLPGSVRVGTLKAGESAVRIAVVQGLAAAKALVKAIREGRVEADLVEVMACPGGCVGGAGQPIELDPAKRAARTEGIARADGERAIRSTGDNPLVAEFYRSRLGCSPGGHRAHELLHTSYSSKRRIADTAIPLVVGTGAEKIPVKVCVGTSCFLRGSQALLAELIKRVEAEGLAELVDVSATFCSESCDRGPTVQVGGTAIHKATPELALAQLRAALAKAPAGATAGA